MLAGAVVGPRGEPIPGAAVRAVVRRRGMHDVPGLDPIAPLIRTTDAQGRFRFERLPRDASAALLVAAPGWGSVSPGVAPGGADLPYRPGRRGFGSDPPPGPAVAADMRADGRPASAVGGTAASAAGRGLAAVRDRSVA